MCRPDECDETEVNRNAVMQRVSDLLYGACGRHINKDACLNDNLSFKELQRWIMAMNDAFTPSWHAISLFSLNNLDQCETIETVVGFVMRYLERNTKGGNR